MRRVGHNIIIKQTENSWETTGTKERRSEREGFRDRGGEGERASLQVKHL